MMSVMRISQRSAGSILSGLIVSTTLLLAASGEPGTAHAQSPDVKPPACLKAFGCPTPPGLKVRKDLPRNPLEETLPAKRKRVDPRKSSRKKQNARNKQNEKKRSTLKRAPPYDVLVTPIRKPGIGRGVVPLPDRPLTEADDGRRRDAAGRGDVSRIALGYSEPQKLDKDKVGRDCEGGSLRGGVDCVTVRMDDGFLAWRGGVEGYVDARLDVRVRPVVEELFGGRFYRITLEIGSPAITIPDDLKPEARRRAFADVAVIMSRLRRWKKTTTEAEARRLRLEKTATVGLRSPFRELKILRLSAPARLKVRLGPKTDPDVRIRFVRAIDGRFESLTEPLKFGQMFFVEALFKKAPDENLQSVRLTFDDLPGPRIPVKRTPKDAKLFRSQGYHLMDGYSDAR